ncbi:MAG: putative Ig domain-containing protein [Blastocatellia bacterium]
MLRGKHSIRWAFLLLLACSLGSLWIFASNSPKPHPGRSQTGQGGHLASLRNWARHGLLPSGFPGTTAPPFRRAAGLAAPRDLKVETKTIPASVNQVTINLDYTAVGTEFGLSFSVHFNRTHLEYVSTSVGSALPNWTLLTNSSAAATNGRLVYGLMGDINTMTPLPAGEARMMTLTFNVLPAAKCGVTSPITLSGAPSTILVADPTGTALTPPTIIAGAVIVTANPIAFVTPLSLTGALLGTPYTQSLVANGGSGTIAGYAVTGGALPAGLSLSPSGTISGTPSSPGTFSVTVTATDSNGCSGSQIFSLSVSCPTISFGSLILPTATTKIPYSQQISAIPSGGAYQYTVTSGTLPPGLSLGPSSGLLSGIPTTTGAYSFTITATGWAIGFGGCTGLFSAVLDVIETNVPPITGGPATPTLPAPNLGPGGVVTLTQTLTNNIPFNFTTTFSATLPQGLNAIPGGCSVPYGSCSIGPATTAVSTSAEDQPARQLTAEVLSSSQAVTQVVSWAGTIPANSSLTITYLVQVSTQALSGTQYCVTTTIGGATGPSTCLTVTVPPVGPGLPLLASGPADDQKPASVLLFNLYTSSINSARSDARLAITNTNPVNPVSVHLFFVDGSNGSVASQVLLLTQNQTVSFLMSQVDPAVTGYLLAIAVNPDGCPAIHNDLIGESAVKFESGHQANLPAMGISGLSAGSSVCRPDTTAATLQFDGLHYSALPRTLAVDSLPSLASGNSPMLIVNRIGGDLTANGLPVGTISGLLFNDIETSQSFSLVGDQCQLRGILGNNFPRTVPRYTTVIPPGRVGWMKFWANQDHAITGVSMNEALAGFSGGHNLHVLTTTNSASLTIPVFPVR